MDAMVEPWHDLENDLVRWSAVNELVIPAEAQRKAGTQ